ncbi:hypothetical protein ACFQJ7_08245 [Halovenus rubra]|uniref:Uncharacterized protein n=2 Tax=Halovenus rubra TaxID=869890 RepID=A0ACC7E3F6_9EURY|nr:hypothetical protein [Halovenus rubra]
MSKPDIVALDDASTYAYSSHIRIEGTELQIGDLLLVFDHDDEQTVNFFERVYGFNWPGVITHQIDGPVPAEMHEYENLAEDLASGKIAVPPEIAQTSFFVDDNTVRTLSLYEHSYRDGQQPILIDEMRDPLSRSPSEQTVTLCTNGNDVVEELFEASPPSSKAEAEDVLDFLDTAGYDTDDVPESRRF